MKQGRPGAISYKVAMHVCKKIIKIYTDFENKHSKNILMNPSFISFNSANIESNDFISNSPRYEVTLGYHEEDIQKRKADVKAALKILDGKV